MPGASDRPDAPRPGEPAAAGSGREEEPQRIGKRIKLPIPVRVKIGDGASRLSRLRDLSPVGLFIEGSLGGAREQPVIVLFDGYPGICEAFLLHGRIARIEEGAKPGLGIAIDRAASSPEVLEQFRSLVLHFIRHRPLLDELERGFFEGRCPDCGWIGRVGTRRPICSRCGQTVKELTRAPAPGEGI